MARRETGLPFYPHFVIEDVIVILVYLILFLGIIFFFPFLFFPPEAFERADPFVTPAHIKPEWYFLASYQLLKVVPGKVLGVSLQILVVAFLFFLPLIDRSPERHPLKRPLFTILAILGLLSFVGLSVWGHYS
ncbi:MAG: hypothetical protein HYY20_04810 [Candidatus Tectomicrobia bacterium]|uniref:Cytochrome b/b6 C-terminal region profile domain-containing protein n=1 Tax=Tectimicrobiota bacterium TaxID=2528274 RepID=A0A932CN60_UNCTE|nr:hypothetical protein [Candidatus Tectomicrobia bacterium]